MVPFSFRPDKYKIKRHFWNALSFFSSWHLQAGLPKKLLLKCFSRKTRKTYHRLSLQCSKIRRWYWCWLSLLLRLAEVLVGKTGIPWVKTTVRNKGFNDKSCYICSNRQKVFFSLFLMSSPEAMNCQGVSMYHFAVKTFIGPFTSPIKAKLSQIFV